LVHLSRCFSEEREPISRFRVQIGVGSSQQNPGVVAIRLPGLPDQQQFQVMAMQPQVVLAEATVSVGYHGLS